MRWLFALSLLACRAAADFYQVNVERQVFPDVTCEKYSENSQPLPSQCGCDADLKGAIVRVDSGYNEKTDRLLCAACPPEVTPSFEPATGTLTLSPSTGTAVNVSKLVEALRAVTFTSQDTSGEPKAVTFNYGDALFSPATGQFYKYFTGPLSWSAAQTYCGSPANSVLTSTGYLATVSSAEEQAIVASLAGGNAAWLGGTDDSESNKWNWVTGPHGCPPSASCADYASGGWFYQDGSATQPTTSLGRTLYSNWDSAEPGDDTTGNCVLMQASGLWKSEDEPVWHGFVCGWHGVDEICLADFDVAQTATLVAGCSSYTSGTSCETLAGGQCIWDPNLTPSCTPSTCRELSSQPMCHKDSRCYWSIADDGIGVCVQTRCSVLYGTQEKCEADRACLWYNSAPIAGNQTAGVCGVVRCPMVTERCACVVYEGCDWNLELAACETVKNSGCPVMDIVVGMDGSGSLSARFGSHPVGYYGVIEHLRDWVKDITFTGEQTKVGTSTATTGFRVAFVTFARSQDPVYAPGRGVQNPGLRCRPDWGCVPGVGGTGGDAWIDFGMQPDGWKAAFPIPGTTGETPGHITGLRSEADADLTWHEAFYHVWWSRGRRNIMPAMFMANAWFEESDTPNRKKVLLLITDGASQDTTQAKLFTDSILSALGVEVFGVVLRQGDAANINSIAAEVELRVLVAAPADTHIMNVALEDFRVSVLDNLCNPDAGFGVELVGTSKLCRRHSTDVACFDETACEWNYAAQTCQQSACHKHCSSEACRNFGCDWVDDLCQHPRVGSCAGYQSKEMCGTGTCCEWDGATCLEDSCCLLSTRETCNTYEVADPKCTQTGEEDGPCVRNVCEWDATVSPAKCTSIPCVSLFEQSSCDTDSACQWTSDSCSELPCIADTFGTCTSDPKCQWDAFASPSCSVRYCAAYTEEEACNNDPICHVDSTATPIRCERLACGYAEDEAECTGDCVWVDNAGGALPTTAAYAAAPAFCRPKTCYDLTTSCECSTSALACHWESNKCISENFQQCPDLDVLFLVDGSWSMQNSFGKHAHGYYALMEMLKDWMATVPVTGDKAGAGVAGGSTGAFRITFVQFSAAGATGIRKAICTECTGGRLSGDRLELIADVHYHEANYIKQGTILLPALQAAEDVFKDNVAGRGKVMIILCDGMLKDNPMSDLDGEVKSIIGSGVIIFGIVIRRTQGSNSIDQEAQRLLKPLLSSPQDDYFLNLQLDEIPDTVLAQFCDPNSVLGRAVAPPVNTDHFKCAVWGYPNECNVDAECEWQQPALSDADCTSAAGCPTLNCQPVPDEYKDLWSCDYCRPQRGTIVCGPLFVPSHTSTGTCGKSLCAAYCTDTDCVDAGCQWDTSLGCIRTVCSYGTRGACMADEDGLCEWNGVCAPKKCSSVFVKEKCEKDPACEWDVGTNPPTCQKAETCGSNDEGTCKASDLCVWQQCRNTPADCSLFGPPSTYSLVLCPSFDGCSFVGADEDLLCKQTGVSCTDYCRDATCTWTTVDTCKSDENCNWEAGKCREDYCAFYPNQAVCAFDTLCEWKAKSTDTDTEYCREKVCEFTEDADVCTADVRCDWDGAACQTTYCGKYLEEMRCDDDGRCEWGETGACVANPCEAKYTQSPPTTIDAAGCKDDDACEVMTDSLGTYCKVEACSEYKEKCDCSSNEACVWTDEGTCVQGSFVTCPDLDVVFILDGSASMQVKFGHHPHGYYGLIEILRDWMTTLPLTGEKAGTPSTVTGGTFRLAFIQFSGLNYMQPFAKIADCTGCTQGRFSGVLTELDTDLAWHHTNYYKMGTMLELSMDMAVAIFKDSPAHRRNVLIVFTDGVIYDPARIPPKRALLDSEDVKTFGVVIRKTQEHTQVDIDAQTSLLPIVSEPTAQHFLNIPLDDIPSSLLGDFCDPNSLFGASIQQHAEAVDPAEIPCSKWSGAECLVDTKCAYVPFPAAPTCEDHDECPNLNCKIRPALVTQTYTCSQCQFAGGVLDCDETYSFDTKPASYCTKSECLCFTEDPCNSDDNCEWNVDNCVQKVCNFPTEDECTKGIRADACEWDGGCERKKCPYMSETICKGFEGCYWDNTVFPEVCKPETNCASNVAEAACVNDPSGACMWDTFCPLSEAPCTEKCIDKLCQHTDEATCNGDTLCQWDANAVSGATKDTSIPCTPKVCPRYVNELDCLGDMLCQWDGSTTPACTEDACALLGSEYHCAQDKYCIWSTDRGGCQTEYCWKQYGTDRTRCLADEECLLIGGECTKDSCDNVNLVDDAACKCRAAEDCVWDQGLNGGSGKCTVAGYNACPPLDLTIVFDGSGSMSANFGRHPSGYEGLLSVLRQWIHDLPLTGDPATAGTNSVALGFRVALIQFSGLVDPGVVNVDPTTKGRLTGDVTEVDAALDWHLNNPIFTRTYIQHALETAVETFRYSPDTRKDVLLVFTDGRLNDPLVLGGVKSDLVGLGVKTFGIVVRRFETKQQMDIRAEETMKQMVSDFADNHFLNLQIDEIASSALNSFCDANGLFGGLIVEDVPDVDKECQAIAAWERCADDATCAWDPRQAACTKSACGKYCSSTDCKAAADNCAWRSLQNICVRVVCPDHAGSAQCDSDPECKWDGAACTPDRTCPDYGEAAACAANDACHWNPGFAIGTEVRPFDGALDCAGIASFKDGCSCNSPLTGAVVSITTNFQVNKDTLVCSGCGSLTSTYDSIMGALYLSGTGSVTAYATAISSVVFQTTSTSTAPRTITYNFGPAAYSPATHHFYRFFPSGGTTWTEAQDKCSTGGDLLGLQGYLATITSKREQDFLYSTVGAAGWIGASDVGDESAWRWVTGPEGCPPKPACDLGPSAAGTDPTQGAGAEVHDGLAFYSAAGGIARGLYANWHVGEPDDYRQACAGSCAGGGQDFASIRPGDGMWADEALDQPVRGYVCEWGGIGELCVTIDDIVGDITLYPGTGRCGKTPGKIPPETPVPFPATPIPEDPLPPVAPVPSLCEPFDRAVCLEFNGCIWSSAAGECVEGTCSSVGFAGDCSALPDCYWKPSLDGGATDPAKCLPAVDRCSDIFRADVCTGYPLCELTSEDACSIRRNLTCVWVTGKGGVGACVERPCPYDTQDYCEADANCRWAVDSVEPQCVVDPCTPKSTETACLADQNGMPSVCTFNAGSAPPCELNVCAAHSDESKCGQDELKRCEWVVNGEYAYCTVTPCYEHGSDKQACNAHAKKLCVYNTQTSTCEYRTCDAYTMENYLAVAGETDTNVCSCRSDPKCTWDNAGNGCVSQVYNGCPDLDLVLLIDGSGTMKKSFGRHQVGFFALLEMLRSWFGRLPLNGESHAVGANSKITAGGFRAALVQFSPPAPVHIDPDTQGRLTGLRAELEAAVSWHEANPLFKTTFIDLGLDQAVAAFKDSPVHRKKVLLILTDGRIMDAAILGPEKAGLQAEGVETFGIVIRRQSSHTQADLDASDALGQVVSAPKDVHQLSLTMDEVGESVLDTFCDATGPFGQLLVSPTSAACSAHLQDSCNRQPTCQWDAFALRCADSGCLEYCSESKCTVISEGECVWDAASKTCWANRCSTWTDKPACAEHSPCVWDALAGSCKDPEGCELYAKQSICEEYPQCQWNVGYLPIEDAGNPPDPLLPYETLDCNAISTPGACNVMLAGASVSIELGFSAADDTLACTACSRLKVAAEYDKQTGVLAMWPASGAQLSLGIFAQAIASATFETTDLTGASKRITYNYGHALYSSETRRYYKRVLADGKSWTEAAAACEAEGNKLLGLTGYLATIASEAEQALVDEKLAGPGETLWIGASDAAADGSWRWVAGPEGCPPRPSCDIPTQPGGGLLFFEAGAAAARQFSNWRTGEPDGSATAEDYAAVTATGRWGSFPGAAASTGYLCEWGGLGSMDLNIHEAHGTTDFVRMTEATFGACVDGEACPAYPDISTCNTDNRCKWVDPGKCVPTDHCSALTVDRDACDKEVSCEVDLTQTSKPCVDLVGCPNFMSDETCNAEPLCKWNYLKGKCQAATGCRASTTAAACNAMVDCNWNAAFEEGAVARPFAGSLKSGAFAYTGGCSAATQISGAYVSIESGYVPGDLLTCDDCSPTKPASKIHSSFDADTALLRLSGDASIAEYADVLRGIGFWTSSDNKQDRRVTFNFGDAVYSSLTRHFYDYTAGSKAWSEARAACEAREFLGLTGYLPTVTNRDEQRAIESKFKQSTWLGGRDKGEPAGDAEVGNGGSVVSTWEWATGPEAGGDKAVFWTGLGARGQSVNSMYTAWNTDEPNDDRSCGAGCDAGQDYLYMSLPSGLWSDREESFAAAGYLCEYGGLGSLCVDLSDVMGTRVLSAKTNSMLSANAEGLCADAGIDRCIAHLSAGLCLEQTTCYWDVATERCLDVLTNCCADDQHGGCSSEGCCVCSTGWDTCNTVGVTANCHLYSDGAACGWCDPVAKCSGRGLCLSDGTCLCRDGWSGASCSVATCSPAGPQILTAHPNTPMRDSTFIVLIHGCGFNPSDIVKVVSRGRPCSSSNPSEDSCWYEGQAGADGVVLRLSDTTCPDSAIVTMPVIEPNSTTELIFNMSAGWSTTDAFKDYRVCYSTNNGSSWTHVKTHTPTGEDMEFQRVCKDYFTCPSFRGAAPLEDCDSCGFLCVLAWILLIFSLVVLLLLLYLLYRVFVNPPKNKTLDYEKFSMMEIQKRNAQKPILSREDSVVSLDDRHDV
ncbi:Halomucin [Diplonema papillatum]|nr:Halomucin [Diplonema papillatum]